MSKLFIGTVIGMILGYVYYRFVGCSTGACPITSNPYASMVYGGLIGAVIAGK